MGGIFDSIEWLNAEDFSYEHLLTIIIIAAVLLSKLSRKPRSEATEKQAPQMPTGGDIDARTETLTEMRRTVAKRKPRVMPGAPAENYTPHTYATYDTSTAANPDEAEAMAFAMYNGDMRAKTSIESAEPTEPQKESEAEINAANFDPRAAVIYSEILKPKFEE